MVTRGNRWKVTFRFLRRAALHEIREAGHDVPGDADLRQMGALRRLHAAENLQLRGDHDPAPLRHK